MLSSWVFGFADRIELHVMMEGLRLAIRSAWLALLLRQTCGISHSLLTAAAQGAESCLGFRRGARTLQAVKQARYLGSKFKEISHFFIARRIVNLARRSEVDRRNTSSESCFRARAMRAITS